MERKRLFGFSLFFLVISPLLIFETAAVATPVADHGRLQVVEQVLVDAQGEPVQLKGASSHGLQWYGWGDCIQEASLEALAWDWGADLFRVSLYVDEGGYKTDPEGFTAMVDTSVEAASSLGMYVIIDWHILTPGDPWDNVTHAREFFAHMSQEHGDKENIIYEICNEPSGVAWSRIKSYAEEIIPIIRANDPLGIIVVGTPAWSSFGISEGRDIQEITGDPLTGEMGTNVLYAFHFYAASHGADYRAKIEAAAGQVPIFVTEWGTQSYTGDGSNDLESSQQWVDLMEAANISWAYWNYSDDWRSGAVFEPGTCPDGPWTGDSLKESGQLVLGWLQGTAMEAACGDGIDNDGDGLIDMEDPGCDHQNDTSEIDPSPEQPQCDDGQDNDGDGLVDLDDPGCASSEDDDEYNPPVSGELDTRVTITDDWGTGYCADVQVTNGTTETVAWSVTVGVDGPVTDLWNGQFQQDGRILQVSGASWNRSLAAGQSTSFGFCAERTNLPLPACSDGIDNDGDDFIDMEDPGCVSPEDDNEFHSLAADCNEENYKGCISGLWPEVTEVGDDEPWHHSRSTHYGLTYAGACGFGLYGLCTPSFSFTDPELQDKCTRFCGAYPDLCRDPAGTSLRGNFTAPQGNYYTQHWPSLSEDGNNYLSCGECFEVVRTKIDGNDYLPGQDGYQDPVVVQISDSCPCGPNPKWCCGSGRNDCGEVSHFEYGCPLPPGPPAPPLDHDPLPGESIHLDLSNIAMARLQTGDPNGTITEGVIPIRYRRVPCPVVGDIHVWVRTGAGPYWFSINVVNISGTGTLAKVEAYRNPGPVYDGGPDLPGEWVPLMRDPNYAHPQERYGAWMTPNVSNVQPFSLPLSIRITDFPGRTLTASELIKQWTPEDESLQEMYYIDTGLQFQDGCTTDADCDDGLWCNGTETCDPGSGCKAGTSPVCDDGNSCTVDLCDELADSCTGTCSASGPEDPCCDDPACEEERENGICQTAPLAQCDDGEDNDGDGLTDLDDPGCDDPLDDDEANDPGPGEVTAEVIIRDDWTTGYCADIVIRNSGSQSVDWKVSVQIEGRTTTLWNALYEEQDGTLTLEGLSWNNEVPAGGTVNSVGFCAQR